MILYICVDSHIREASTGVQSPIDLSNDFLLHTKNSTFKDLGLGERELVTILPNPILAVLGPRELNGLEPEIWFT